jgi:hypothetical protein
VAIIIEASLGFLGVGIPPPTPTRGNMLADALNAGLVPSWWLVLVPGAAITLTVLTFNSWATAFATSWHIACEDHAFAAPRGCLWHRHGGKQRLGSIPDKRIQFACADWCAA